MPRTSVPLPAVPVNADALAGALAHDLEIRDHVATLVNARALHAEVAAEVRDIPSDEEYLRLDRAADVAHAAIVARLHPSNVAEANLFEARVREIAASANPDILDVVDLGSIHHAIATGRESDLNTAFLFSDPNNPGREIQWVGAGPLTVSMIRRLAEGLPDLAFDLEKTRLQGEGTCRLIEVAPTGYAPAVRVGGPGGSDVQEISTGELSSWIAEAAPTPERARDADRPEPNLLTPSP